MRQATLSVLNNLRDLVRDERGATAIEYAIIAGCISIAIVVAATGIGTTLNNMFTSVKNGFPS